MVKGAYKRRQILSEARSKLNAGKFTSASSYSSSSSNSSGSSSGTASSCSSSSLEKFRSIGTNTAITSCDVGTMTDIDVSTQDAATMTSANTVCVTTMTEPFGDDDGAERQRNTEGANGDELQVYT
ncbi:unnamed protein product [Anisakis simplex]|uniref:Uncharacterized protein n=1 Tax=Anisakis simplex TaxID=6269 RepID=A0A0M3K6I4_ANISI|nr:unnamed protein product [Anisakis simplex]